MSDTHATNESDFEIDLGPADAAAPSDDFEVDLGVDSNDEPDDGVSIDLSEPEEPADDEADASDEAVLDALREQLRGQVGDWYVIHTYSGMENRVKQNLDSRVKTLGMEEYIFETVVPTEEVVETRSGTRKTVTRTVLPGYVLVRMELTDASWAAVRHTPSVTGFVAHANAPVPLSLDEVHKMLAPAALAKAAAAASGPKKRARKVEVADFKVGDSVMVVNGPFSGVHATITEINANSQRLKALVEILGRETPVDLTFNQIAKV
ncbi:MAG: transcription termination/antitermination protein NusG [Micropruina sp.]|uniref:transcription termination/antitermination protein NusG n=1 Tax=Micropruina sp. TaxID=2737536 RepID=UPI0039E3FE71